MGGYFQDIISLLLNPPGNLVYHLVLAFSVAGALAIALNYWRESDEPQALRMVFGLSCLLLLRLSLFVAAGLAWQGVINGYLLLPPLDRAVNLIGLVLIVWMWVFPQPTRLGDAASLLIGLLAGALFVFSMVWWSGQSAQSGFMGSWPDLASEMTSIAVSTAGGLLLVMRRPAGWGYGLGMLFILLVGDVAYLTYPFPEGDFAGAVRLAQMVAYPMLLLLPVRFSTRLSAEQPTQEPDSTLQGVIPDEKQRTSVYNQLLFMVNETDPQKFYQSIVKLVAQEWLADLCLLVSPPGPHGKIEILSGYDLIQEQSLGSSILNSQSIPVIASALRRGRALRLPASSTSPDLAGLGKLLEIKSIGHLMAVPVLDEKTDLLAGLIMMTPYTKRGWTADDQSQISDFTAPLAQVLQHHQVIASLKKGFDRASAELRAAQDETEKYRQENERLVAQLGLNLDKDSDQLVHAASIAALLAAHEAAQEKIERLQAENTRLQGEGLAPPAGETELFAAGDALTHTPDYADSQAEAELRLALEEVAYLKSLIYESDRKLLEYKQEVAAQPPNAIQAQEITALVQDLRQPMSSIVGYTDFLLGESIGILGALQRRFLERIRSSAERLAGMLDNLNQISGTANLLPDSGADDIHIPDLIDAAISQTSALMRQKNIALRMDLPKNIPVVSNSKAALQKLMEVLLEHASQVSPANGEITLRVRLEGENGAKDFVLIQVADQGGGISPEVAPILNASSPGDKPAELSGLQPGREKLALLRNLAESLGGRVWVDNNPGAGSVFSLLFPIALNSDDNNNIAGGFG